MKRRIIAWVMTFMIVFGTMPANIWQAMAADTTGEATADPLYAVENKDSISTSETGGIYLNKQLSKLNNDGKGEITLETYVEGSVQTDSVPVDIVLVLDQSGSMDTKDVPVEKGYKKTSGTAAELYENRSNLYVKIGEDKYAKVSVTRTVSGTEYVYTSYSGHDNRDYSRNSSNLYHLCDDGEYGRVSVNRNGNRYTYTCGGCGSLGTSNNDDGTPSFSDSLYRRETVSVYQYTFTYENAQGATVTESVVGNASAPEWDFYAYYDGNTDITRLTALKEAAASFIASVEEKNAAITDADDKHRIAIAGFAMGDTTDNSDSYPIYMNTELLSVMNGDSVGK